MKLAAMEGLYRGQEGAGLVVIGALNPDKKIDNEEDPFIFRIQIPKLLSLLGYRTSDAFVPGVEDILEGGYAYTDKNGIERVALSAEQKIERGKLAIKALADYKAASDAGDEALMKYHRRILDENFEYFGYGYLNSPASIVPNVPLTFYAFRVMVGLGMLFILFFATVLFVVFRKDYRFKRWFLWASVFMIPLAYIASQAGWIVAEVGRQPWVIQDILPTVAAVSRIDAGAVQVTFFLFLIIFTTLLIAELRIMFTQIKIGPKEGGH
jgi:cytochrome d ubiquinol oxidase subunit I